MIKEVGVVGAGIMGHGIAELFAVSGYQVVINDVNVEILTKAIEKISWSLQRLGKRGEIADDPEAIMSRIRTTTELSDFASLDLVIEVVKEKTEIKRQVLSKLGRTVKKSCIIASNTSTIPITELASMTGNEGKFVGIHFSNPPVIMPLVEIVKGENTDEKTMEIAKDFVKSLGKDYVVLLKDIPGFLVNRLNDRTILEAMSILEEGTPKEVLDAMVRFRLGFPMGMCELLDFVGIDTVYEANREMVRRGFNSRSSEILREKVENGLLGSKTGEGFYLYPEINEYARPHIIPLEEMYKLDPLRILSPAVNEAAWLMRNGVCSREDIEKAMVMAMNWPHGPLEYADRFGIDEVVRVLRERWAESGESRYSPDTLLLEMLEKNRLGWKTGTGFLDWRYNEEQYGPVTLSRMNDYAIVLMNRPSRLNSLDQDTWKGIRKALESVREDLAIRSVIVTGSGRAFSAGDDIKMMEDWKGGSDAKFWMSEFAEPLMDLLSNYPKPLISAVNGLAFGGGCELNIFFDIVISSEKAVFALPEGLIGTMPPIASSYGYSLVNRKFARYALTGEWFSAVEAKDLGLVDIVVPHGHLNSAICEITDKISRVAPLSSRSVKASVNLNREVYRGQAKYASNELVILSSTFDFKEGQKAFLEKRRPRWEGK